VSHSDGLKRLLHSRLNDYLHLFEETISTQIGELSDLMQLKGVSTFPNNMASVHVVDCIGRNEPINNKSIADKLSMSRANITKITTKLLEEGFIKRSQLNDNKKEVYFSLSQKGRQVFDLHSRMDEAIAQRFIRTLDNFTESELQASLKFIQTLIDRIDIVVKGDGKVLEALSDKSDC
jgi:DNA-binding MarR family transcriptional regulator